MGTRAKDRPISEITLRKYEKPYKMSERETVRKLCLSLGLLQPGDSRDIIVDIFHLIISHKLGVHYAKLEDELIKRRKKLNLPLLGATPANIHRQLRRLRDMQLIDKNLHRYRLTEGMSLKEIVEERVVKYHLDSILERIKEYIDKLSKDKGK